ncbi:hypothetical protein L3Q82_005998 [Scortum barcoo]|uniref:Uncharacterized protein n=1 Tax=Scortum barcoo TaxID=214431 RepID=A0ACB8X2B5_9TELE|nr:hypothetical protein L3Q82_005998 [Scortum barcoo]
MDGWMDFEAKNQYLAASERHFSPGSPEETPLHKMLFLLAAALCCLCSALVAMAAELIQEDLTLTRRVGQKVSFSCGTEQCSDSYVYWYQKKDTETFTRIIRIDKTFETTDLLVNQVFSLHGLPTDTVSSCGPQFISRVWKFFMIIHPTFLRPHAVQMAAPHPPP